MATPPEPTRDGPEGEPPPALPAYFGGYALVFVGIIGLALALVLVAKLLR